MTSMMMSKLIVERKHMKSKRSHAKKEARLARKLERQNHISPYKMRKYELDAQGNLVDWRDYSKISFVSYCKDTPNNRFKGKDITPSSKKKMDLIDIEDIPGFDTLHEANMFMGKEFDSQIAA